MNDPRKHHFLPQFYLENFATDETRGKKVSQIWSIWKGQDPKHFVSAVGDTGCIRDFHRLDQGDSSLDEYRLEKKIATLEGSQSVLLRRILESRSVTQNEKEDLSSLLYFMKQRVPANREYIRDFLGKNIKDILDRSYERGDLPPMPEGLKELVAGRPLSEVFGTNISNWKILEFMFSSLDEEGRNTSIAAMNWGIAEAEESRFVTCDNPVVFYCGDRKARGPYGIGFLDREVEINFPVSDRFTIVGRWNSVEAYRLLSAEEVGEINRRMITNADKAIFASSVDAELLELVKFHSNDKAGMKLDQLRTPDGTAYVARNIPVFPANEYE